MADGESLVVSRSAAFSENSVKADDRVDPLVHRHLPALDGIRFIAAFCVLLGHGYSYVVASPGQMLDPLSKLIVELPGLGMTLFFVLSGFVIHLNYHRSVGIGRGGTFDFFFARFSRLYPLFLVVFAVDFFHLLWLQGYLNGTPRHDFALWGPLPFFLTFTQTWLFIPFDGHALFEHYTYLTANAQATGAMWSLSVEWLFYLVYPLLAAWLSRRGGRQLAVLAVATASAGLCYYVWTAYYTFAIHSFGMKLFGTPTLASAFVTWMIFYSPAGRIFEFLLGACAAQYYLSRGRRRYGVSQWPAVSCAIVAAAIVGWIVTSSLVHFTLSGVNASCIAGLVAIFVYLVVRHPTPISRALSIPVLVKGGEASYSLYLLHWYTMQQWAASYAAGLARPVRLLIFLVGIVLSIALARAVYLLFERPARLWLRARLLGHGERGRPASAREQTAAIPTLPAGSSSIKRLP